MEFNITIDKIEKWYRHSTKEWCITVVATTDNCSLVINYPAKTLNKARHDMIKKLPLDLMKEEFRHRLEHHEFDKYI